MIVFINSFKQYGDRPAATVDYIIAVTALAKRLG